MKLSWLKKRLRLPAADVYKQDNSNELLYSNSNFIVSPA